MLEFIVTPPGKLPDVLAKLVAFVAATVKLTAPAAATVPKFPAEVVHVGRSDTCKKHGGAEKVRKAIVNLLNLTDDNTSVPKTKYWEEIRLRYRPNSTNIKIGIIKTNAIKKTYIQETT